MHVGSERQAERPQRDRPGRMQCRRAGRAATRVLVADVQRGRGGARHPRRETPQAHLTGVRRPVEGGEPDADDDVRQGDEQHRPHPHAARVRFRSRAHRNHAGAI